MCDYDSYEPDDIRLQLKDNPVHTFLYLTGTPEAFAKADEIIRQVEKKGVEPADGSYSWLPEEIRRGEDGNAQWYDIIIDNHVPQIYEQLKAIDGMERVVFYCYCDFDSNVYSNDTDRLLDSRRADFGIPANLEFAELEYYPDLYDLASTNYK